METYWSSLGERNFDKKIHILRSDSYWHQFTSEDRCQFISQHLPSKLTIHIIHVLDVCLKDSPFASYSSKPTRIIYTFCVDLIQTFKQKAILEHFIMSNAPLWLIQIAIWSGENPFEEDDWCPTANPRFVHDKQNLKVGDTLLCCYRWSVVPYMASVVAEDNNMILMHYHGYSKIYREWVPQQSSRFSFTSSLQPNRKFSIGISVYQRALYAENEAPLHLRHNRYSAELSILWKIYLMRIKQWVSFVNSMNILLPPLVDIIFGYHELISISDEVDAFCEFDSNSQSLLWFAKIIKL